MRPIRGDKNVAPDDPIEGREKRTRWDHPGLRFVPYTKSSQRTIEIY